MLWLVQKLFRAIVIFKLPCHRYSHLRLVENVQTVFILVVVYL